MNIKKLNEELRKLNETQIEGDDELTNILNGTWDRSQPIAEVVIPNIDKFSEEDLIQILDKGAHIDKSLSLFPSNFDIDKFGYYPAKLAAALAKSFDSECLTDIYNVYYKRSRRGDANKWKDAIKAWKRHIFLNGFDTNTKEAIAEDDGTWISQLHEVLKQYEPAVDEYLMASIPEGVLSNIEE